MGRTQTQKTRKTQKFRHANYLSADGMVTSTWGPAKWHTLHMESFNYPVHPTDAQKQQYRTNLINMQHVLPCGKCRVNLDKNFSRLPPDMCHFKTRDTYSRYIYNLHELVNEMLNKKSGLTFEMVRERYEKFRARCADKHHHTSTLSHAQKRKESGCTKAKYKSRVIGLGLRLGLERTPFESD